MIPGKHAVILVYSTSYAIRAERVLHLAGIETKLVPVPRHLSSNCGVCVRITQLERERARDALAQAGVEIEGVHDLD